MKAFKHADTNTFAHTHEHVHELCVQSCHSSTIHMSVFLEDRNGVAKLAYAHLSVSLVPVNQKNKRKIQQNA